MNKFTSNFLILSFLPLFYSCAQTNSRNWPSPQNITNVMDTRGIIELSGLHYNPVKNLLYAVQDNGGLYVLKYNSVTNQFTKVGNTIHLGGPEGIAQVNYAVDEFYTIDEKNYEIRRFTHNADLSKVNLLHKWNLLLDASHMVNTDNDGPEGIEFIPDSYLKKAGFVSSETDEKYTSKKGMGGLIFIAHQKKGYIWVFDVNPEKDDDYEFVGKYKTNQNESCDLTFDRSTGLLYILHNTDNNSLEMTDLTTKGHVGKERFNTVAEYPIPNPKGNKNVEGVAITPKFATPQKCGVWLCRDVSIEENIKESEDCIWWFSPFTMEGDRIKNWNKPAKK